MKGIFFVPSSYNHRNLQFVFSSNIRNIVCIRPDITVLPIHAAGWGAGIPKNEALQITVAGRQFTVLL